MFENLDFENLIIPVMLLILSNTLTFFSTKKVYENAKTSFFEFCDIPLAIKEAWKDDVVTKDEIIFVANEIKEFADTLRRVK